MNVTTQLETNKFSKLSAEFYAKLFKAQPVVTTLRRYVQSNLRACIVGSGPAGFFTAKYLFNHPKLQEEKVHVTMIEKLPTPYGLVRYGVASS